MIVIYNIHGMTCNGCRSHVEKLLCNVDGVTSVSVNLEKAQAAIEMTSQIPLTAFQKILKDDGDTYHIVNEKEKYHAFKPTYTKPLKTNTPGVFYCPMHCEGDKTYKKSGECPVCGMDLLQIETDYKNNTDTHQKLLRKFWIAIAFTLPIFLIAMSEMLHHNPLYDTMDQKYWNWVQLILSLPVLFYSTWTFFQRAYKSIKNKKLNMFTLVGIGAGVAWLFSVLVMLFSNELPAQFKSELGSVHVYFETSTVILTLVLLGQVLEAKAHKKTNFAVKELLKLSPNTAFKIINNKEIQVNIDEIEINDIVRVKPGSKVPVDGVIIDGETSIDESMVTGEPIAVNKYKDDKVFSGTINGNKSFLMKAERVGSKTLLSQIIHMVDQASRSRAPIQKLADKVSGVFVPIVIFVSIITFIIWYIAGPEPSYVFALVNSLSVLIIACPCALGLATPMSVMVGVGKGAQNGILIKNAEVLQTMNRVNTLVVDKTGTITEGKPSVETFGYFDSRFSEDEIIKYIVSLNKNSEHPLAVATNKYGDSNNITPVKLNSFNSVTGKGVEASINDKSIALGNAKMMDYIHAELSSQMIEVTRRYQMQGKTISYLAINKMVVAYVVIADKIKKSSAIAIKQLQNQGVQVVMLTGDNYDTAKAVNSELNLSYFKANMMPEDKLNEINNLQTSGKVVAMAGDGINDAPALAKSNVGIAIGTGTDVAIESAMITLINGSLHGIVVAKNLSDAVMKNIKQNLFFGLIYNIIGVPIAAGVLFPFFGILLSPMIAALAMSFSSLSVISNALRLKTIKI